MVLYQILELISVIEDQPHFLSDQMMPRQKKKYLNPIVDCLHYLLNNDHELTENQRKKCYEKFQSFKALGASVISKNELKKILSDLGKKVSEQQLLEMIEQADPNGYGYVSYEAFQKIVKFYKGKIYEERADHIQITFQDILKAEKIDKNTPFLTRISWDYLKKYLIKNFELQINIKSMKSSNSTDILGKEEFKALFS